MIKIFISAGEHSGDLLGARLIRALKDELDTQNNIDFQGIGGPLMEREGFKSLFDFSLLSIMGIKEIKVLFCYDAELVFPLILLFMGYIL